LNLLETIAGDQALANRLAQDATSNSNTVSIEVAGFDEKGLRIDIPPTSLDNTSTLVDKVVPHRRVDSMTVSRSFGGDSDYRLVGELGSGGTGIVFQAHQRAVDREVAVKMLRSELAENRVSRERFLTEARVIGGLDHPNVIALHEVYVDDERNLYYSMKRIDGTSWDKQIGSMTIQQNVATLLSVADGIRYAHSRGLIHRDIKPENVMLGRYGEVLLADWGLAINRNEVNAEHDLHQSIGGTPAYMAPELAKGFHGDIVPQSDVYLLGATLFHCLAGFPPHDGDTLVQCIANAAANVIRETDVESDLMDVARKAMQTRPEDRYQSVDEFVAAIKEHRLHEQSTRLLKRACERIDRSDGTDPYGDFRVADALLSEAVEVWSKNDRAIKKREQFRMQLAGIAAERGDLDLASSILETHGESDSDMAKEIRRRIDQRRAGRRKVSRYSALFMQSPDPGLLIDMEVPKIVEVNQAYADLFDYDRDDIVGEALVELDLWACPKQRERLIGLIEKHGSVEEFEAVMLRRDGQRIDVLINGRVVEVQGKEMLVSTIRDISLRKKAEHELQRSRERLRDLQRLAGLATWSYDVASDRVSWSSETFDLTGRKRDEGSPSREEYYSMVHPDDRARLQHANRSAIDSGTAYEISILQKVAGGEYRDVIIRGQPIFDNEGNTVEVYGVVLPK
jgi:PAS domain S-box-containing protein